MATKRYERRKNAVINGGYQFCRPADFEFTRLNNINTIRRAGRGDNDSYNEAVIMLDTETSKSIPGEVCLNYVVAWAISIRAYGVNVCTLYGGNPVECVKTLKKIQSSMEGDRTIVFCHNLSYDYVFLRQFLFAEYGTPRRQLNTKPYYPIYIDFAGGLQLRDSLILAQRSLEKWGIDIQAEHAKASGKWDYDKVRHQKDIEELTDDEKEYIEHDTLCGVECIDRTIITLRKKIYSLPYTATGIPREEARKRGKKARARNYFERIVPDYQTQMLQECVYHGGFTHANRHVIGWKNPASGRDFVSSYPTALLLGKMPCERWAKIEGIKLEDILLKKDEYAFMFLLKMKKPRLKDDWIPMPVLQYSKCTEVINPVLDNGRILCAAYAEIFINEVDLETILEQYDFEGDPIVEHVHFAKKDYLPRWFTDYVYDLFKDKTMEKDGDPVLYAILKAKLNSVYGMCVQKPCKISIDEDYTTGEYRNRKEDLLNPEKLYKKYVENHNSILPYCWGVWCTSIAQRNLFILGKCVTGTWLYSDTDSIYATEWNEEKLAEYNENVKRQLIERGYPAIEYGGKEYWLGIAEADPKKMEYSEFITHGAKRYAGISKYDGKVHITVAGVPKKSGALCLHEDLDLFKPGFVFDGETTGKLQHTHVMSLDGILETKEGDLYADYIDLSPADYTLDDVDVYNWEKIFDEEISIQYYEEE